MSANESEMPPGIPGAYGAIIEGGDSQCVTIYPEGVEDHRLMTEWISSDTVVPEGDWR